MFKAKYKRTFRGLTRMELPIDRKRKLALGKQNGGL